MKWLRRTTAGTAVSRHDLENLLLTFLVMGLIAIYKLIRLGAWN